jgi:uncharacterized membrane protein
MDLRITPSDGPPPAPPRRRGRAWTISRGSRSHAQQRADRIQAFHEELDRLQAEGILALTPEQRGRISAYHQDQLAALSAAYDVDVSLGEKQMSWGVRIAASIGGFAIIAGLVLLFYRFWGDMPAGLQMLVLFVAPLIALWLTGFAAERDRTQYFATLAAVIAIALFILDLSVLNQIFNLADNPHGLLAWGLFAFAIGWEFGLRLPLAAGIVMCLCWPPAALFYWNGYPPAQWLARPEPVVLLSALVFGLGVYLKPEPLAGVVRASGAGLYLLAILALAGLNARSLLGFDLRTSERLYDIVGFLSAAGLIALGIRRNWPGMVYLGTGAFALFLWIRLHRWFWDLLPKYLFFLLVGAIAIALVALFLKLRRRMQLRAHAQAWAASPQAWPPAPQAMDSLSAGLPPDPPANPYQGGNPA